MYLLEIYIYVIIYFSEPEYSDLSQLTKFKNKNDMKQPNSMKCALSDICPILFLLDPIVIEYLK